jgi:hypothetical protein
MKTYQQLISLLAVFLISSSLFAAEITLPNGEFSVAATEL